MQRTKPRSVSIYFEYTPQAIFVVVFIHGLSLFINAGFSDIQSQTINK